MNFAEALLVEECNLFFGINLPCAEVPARCTCIGPTKVWFYPMDKKSVLIPTKEIKLIADWKKFDQKRYSHQTQLGFWD